MCACSRVYWEVLLLAHCYAQGLVLLCFRTMPFRLCICICIFTCIYIYICCWSYMHTYKSPTCIRKRAQQTHTCTHVKEFCIRINSKIKESETKNVYTLCTHPEIHTHTHTHGSRSVSHSLSNTHTHTLTNSPFL